MLKEIRFINWKSFKDSKIYIDPLNILIGTNASGKSNIVDALAFLRLFVRGDDLQSIFDSSIMDSHLGGIRGGAEYAAMFGENNFSLELVFQKDDNIDYMYKVEIQVKPELKIVNERIDEVYKDNIIMECIFNAEIDKEILIPGYSLFDQYLRNKDRELDEVQYASLFKDSVSVLSQIGIHDNDSKSEKIVLFIVKQLSAIFVYDPIPSTMRNYVKLSNQLNKDGSNIAGIIAHFNNGARKNLEDSLTKYISKLSEVEVKKVWALTTGLKNNDAILCCEEKWGNIDKYKELDASAMSDGTLRLLGILTALLTRPEGSLIVIEEADNGLHPSRAKLLLSILKEIGTRRKIDILITTHNAALMDELGTDMIPFIQVVHRDTQDGTSKITLLEDVKALPKLLAHGSLGELNTKGEIEKSFLQNEVIFDAK